MSGEMDVRTDGKRPGFFQIENHILDGYAKVLGFTAWGIYTTLWRHAWGRTVKRTSVSEIAKTWDCTTRTVMRARKKLEKFSLIRIQKTQSISVVTLLTIEQLDFNEKLLSPSDTIVTSALISQVTPESPPKRHQSHLRGDTDVTHTSKTFKTYKRSPAEGVSIGIDPSTLKNVEDHHASGAALSVKHWIRIKEELKTELLEKEWKLWVRPARLLRVMAGNTMLIALPPNARIIEAAQRRRDLLNAIGHRHGQKYFFALTRYVDEYEKAKLPSDFKLIGDRSEAR